MYLCIFVIYSIRMRRTALLLLFLTFCASLYAQEFRCSVSVNYQKLQQTTQPYPSDDKTVFDNMRQAIEDFVNSRKWTNLSFESNEYIDCSISLILNRRTTANDFEGRLSVQLRRPVYNSNYTTGLFNYVENKDFKFTYNESIPLEYDANTYYSDLTSAISFYLYVMLGVQFDSFAMMGGTPFYEVAQAICQAASSNDDWTPNSSLKSRYWFMENHTNSAYTKLREAYYNYHRLGLDMMTKDQTQARQNIIQSLRDVQSVHKLRSNLLSVQQFVDVKIAEIVSIFTPAPDDEKQQVYTIIKDISPIQVTKMKDWNIK